MILIPIAKMQRNKEDQCHASNIPRISATEQPVIPLSLSIPTLPARLLCHRLLPLPPLSFYFSSPPLSLSDSPSFQRQGASEYKSFFHSDNYLWFPLVPTRPYQFPAPPAILEVMWRPLSHVTHCFVVLSRFLLRSLGQLKRTSVVIYRCFRFF